MYADTMYTGWPYDTNRWIKAYNRPVPSSVQQVVAYRRDKEEAPRRVPGTHEDSRQMMKEVEMPVKQIRGFGES